MKTLEEEFDYIIVGAGTAGCLLANRLSENPKIKILLIESGGWDNNFWVKMPIGYYKLINNKNLTKHFFTKPEKNTFDRSMDWPRGKVIGGSSSINGLIFIRGQREDFDKWEQLGAKGWSYQDVLPYFKKIENFGGSGTQYRGQFGEIKVSKLRKQHPFCETWLKAAQNCGFNYNYDFNGESTLGVGKYDLSIGSRWRSSSASAFLHPIKKRKNLKIMTNSLVEKVFFKNAKAEGVILFSKDQKLKIKCKREVILSAGAIQSPQILQLSGIGSSKLLTKLNIPIVSNLPFVGQNLQDHYQVRLIVKMKKKISLNNDVRNPFKVFSMGLDWLFRGRGDLTVGGIQVGGGLTTKYSKSGQPDIQLGAMPFSVDKPGLPLHKFPGFTTVLWQCHPESRGKIEINSKNPFHSPVISPSYLSSEVDQKTIVEGVKIVRKIYNMSPFKELIEEEITPGENIITDDQILDLARKTGSTVYHPSGTCQMGEGKNAVVNSALEVNGVRGLRVVDASVMPSIVSANTNAATYMIAEKITEQIINKNRS